LQKPGSPAVISPQESAGLEDRGKLQFENNN
jgi:hypothetical protein